MQDFLIYILTPFGFERSQDAPILGASLGMDKVDRLKIRLDKLESAILEITQENFDFYKEQEKYNL